MAALMKTAYDGYRYILYKCAGKKPQLDTGHDTNEQTQLGAVLQRFCNAQS